MFVSLMHGLMFIDVASCRNQRHQLGHGKYTISGGHYSAEYPRSNLTFIASNHFLDMGSVWSNTEDVKSSAPVSSQPDRSTPSSPQSLDQRMSHQRHHHTAVTPANPSFYQQSDKRAYQSMDALSDAHLNEDSSHEHSRGYWSRKGPQHTQRC